MRRARPPGEHSQQIEKACGVCGDCLESPPSLYKAGEEPHTVHVHCFEPSPRTFEILKFVHGQHQGSSQHRWRRHNLGVYSSSMKLFFDKSCASGTPPPRPPLPPHLPSATACAPLARQCTGVCAAHCAHAHCQRAACPPYDYNYPAIGLPGRGLACALAGKDSGGEKCGIVSEGEAGAITGQAVTVDDFVKRGDGSATADVRRPLTPCPG